MSTASPAQRLSLLPVIGALASQAAFVTAVLYYFGWAYSRAFYGHFGVEAHALGYATADYVLFSVNAMFQPLIATLVTILAVLAVRRIPAQHAMSSGRPRTILRRWVGCLIVAGILLVATVAVLIYVPTTLAATLDVVAPLLLMTAAASLGCAHWLRWRYPSILGTKRPPRTVMQIRVLALIAITAIGYLWAVADFAERRGTTEAIRQERASFVDRPAVVVFSVDRLAVEGSGTSRGEITALGEKYRYAYSGLWLLARTDDYYYLLPQQWKAGRDRVVVVSQDDTIRIDIARNP
ncbi:hypothetical protein IU449_00635 [Nocardia higoensis]|uniref:Uncharacterized protein n=1 Tax=Nocardia higoensis TaxID=228599 RepID=A0ABS0D3K8_9NOCA|nr:hypothetical protein [Nocardia higoensis]MBF6353067.1 hypothetical protein [Nocardia higoensis]